jgi:hypothetical protein
MGLVCRKDTVIGRSGEIEKVLGIKRIKVCYLYIFMEMPQRNPPNIVSKRERGEKGLNGI